jgi:anti-sigma regulatory factor (Ser/Thr protein kinase)
MSGSPIELSVPSDAKELPNVRDAVRGWTTAQGWDEHDIADLVLAVDEALTNVIRHGYGGAAGKPIELSLREVRDGAGRAGVEIVVRDYGRQVPLDRICGRDLDDLRPGGLGVHIIRNVMESAEYSHAKGGGMRLVMRKFPRPAPGAPAEGETKA